MMRRHSSKPTSAWRWASRVPTCRKKSAEMVLLDDNFASIERAIEEGRTVFNNLKKTIVFILPTNGGECLTLVAALLLGALLPILPLHILWINLVTTVALAITLAFDPVDAGHHATTAP